MKEKCRMFIKYTRVILLCLIVPLSLHAQDRVDAEVAFSNQDFPQAIELYNGLLETEKGDTSAIKLRLAQAYLYTNDNEKSLGILIQLKNENIDFTSKNGINFWIGVNYYQEQEYTLSRDAFGQELRFQANDYFVSMSYYYLGILAQQNQEYLLAETNYKSALEIIANPNVEVRARYYLASVLLEQKKYAEARENYSSLLLKYPNSPYSENIQYYIAEIAYQLGDYQEALTALESFLSYYPNSRFRENILFYSGSSAFKLGSVAKGENYLVAFLEDYKNSDFRHEAIILLANFYLSTNSYAKAETYLLLAKKDLLDEMQLQQINYNLEQLALKGDDGAKVKVAVNDVIAGPDANVSALGLYLAGVYFKELEPETSYSYFITLFQDYPTSEYAGLVVSDLINYYKNQDDMVSWESLLVTAVNYHRDSPDAPYYLFLLADYYDNAQENDTNALKYYQQVIEAPNANEGIVLEAYYRIGYIYATRAEFYRSTEYFEYLVDRSPQGSPMLAKSLLAIGSNYFNLGEYTSASSYFSQILYQFPGSDTAGQAQLYSGNILLAQKRYRDAVLYFEQAEKKLSSDALKAEASFWAAWANKGVDEDLALAGFDKLISNYAGSNRLGEAYFQRGLIYYFKNQYERSLTDFTKALDFSLPKSSRIENLYYKGIVEVLLGRQDIGIQSITEISRIDPESALPAEAYFKIGEFHFRQKNYNEAYKWYTLNRIDYPVNPNYNAALIGSARSLFYLNDVKTGVDILIEFIKNNPASSDAYIAGNALVDVFNTTIPPNLVDYVYRQLLENSTQVVFLPAFLAYYKSYGLNSSTDFDIMRAYYNHASATNADKNEILYVTGNYYHDNNYYAEAIAVWLQIISRDSSSADQMSDAMLKLAEDYEATADYQRAADSYEAVARRFPSQREMAAKALFKSWELYRRAGDNIRADEAQKFLQENYADLLSGAGF